VSEPTLAGLRVAVDGRYARRPGMGIHVYLRQVIRLLHEAGAEVTLLVNFPVAEAATDGFEGVLWQSFGSSATSRATCATAPTTSTGRRATPASRSCRSAARAASSRSTT